MVEEEKLSISHDQWRFFGAYSGLFVKSYLVIIFAPQMTCGAFFVPNCRKVLNFHD
ncbi:hypothetical protein FC83_GL001436 [Agrilactobacillus composti DSM 18527 = JCM 14202]|uniref:Uncharacterized protein n=1 Tax=Agrilactobacillus composti DSM 18527 = JCM 14202 TaxID=1423734 RepID=A0A0R1XS86_9LACO|nr:hypothetical protein FC83_GL001436 [Agrilactobacillus composti DSM 18527 = JCM 14202]